jgi:hypothetical protein
LVAYNNFLPELSPELAHHIAVNRRLFDFSSGARSAQLEREQSAFVLVNIVLWDAGADLSDFCIGFVRCPQASFLANGWPRIRKFWMQPTQFVWGRAAPLGLTILSLSLWYFAETRQGTTSLPDGYNAIATRLAIFTFGTPAAALFVYGLIAACIRLIPLDSVIARCAFAAIQTVASFGAVSLTLLVADHFLNTDTWFFTWFPFLAAMIFLSVEILFAGLTDPVVEDEDRE